MYTMDSNPDLECGVPGSPNARMRVVAAITIVLYIVGLPVSFLVFLWTHWAAVGVDQRLRQRGEGDTALTNPYIKVRLVRRCWWIDLGCAFATLQPFRWSARRVVGQCSFTSSPPWCV